MIRYAFIMLLIIEMLKLMGRFLKIFRLVRFASVQLGAAF